MKQCIENKNQLELDSDYDINKEMAWLFYTSGIINKRERRYVGIYDNMDY